jgi:sugar phosphate isomerase/epimerase
MPLIGGRAHNPEAVEKVAKLGYPFAEISMKDPEELGSNLSRLLQIKSSYGIDYIGHFPNEDHPVKPEILMDKFVPKIKGIIDLCPELSIRKCTLHFWMDVRWIDPDIAKAKVPIIRNLVEYAALRDVVICIENLSEQYNSFKPLFDIIPELRMTLDIGHAQLLSKENSSYDFIENCFGRIDHIHVHDNRGGTRLEDDLHLPLGQGIIDYPAIFTMLDERGYQSTMTMELKPEELKQTENEIRKYFKHLIR